MRPMTIIAALGTAGGVLAACAAPADPAGTAPSPADAAGTSSVSAPAGSSAITGEGLRIILKLKDARINVDRPEVLARLVASCGCELAYVRPMSGDAHVLVMKTTEAGYDQALARLRADARVEYVDIDKRLTIQR